MAMLSNTRDLFRALSSLLNDPPYFWTLAFLVIIGDACLTQLIVKVIPYTEIDWETYMVHIDVFLKGQHNYTLIEGPTGPLVYPAGHVRIHQLLYILTDSGRHIQFAQQIYAILYTVTLSLACAIYREAGRLPNWVLLLLPLSKRLHSIYVLRLFNDCWAVLAMQAAILMYQNGLDDTATIFYSAALSVKMSILLYLPGVLVIIFKRRGLFSTCRHIMTVIAVQILLASPFLSHDKWAYLNSAFDLKRVFMYKWTVNWRFLSEDTFLSHYWAAGLLVAHAAALVSFGLFRWCNPDGGVWTVLNRGVRSPYLPAGQARITADYVATILFTSNLIGIIFARSLHYQFYSWYAYQIPFLAWRTPYPIIVRLSIMLAIEYAWNVYPSTSCSSLVLLGANLLLLVGVWHHKGMDSSNRIKAT